MVTRTARPWEFKTSLAAHYPWWQVLLCEPAISLLFTAMVQCVTHRVQLKTPKGIITTDGGSPWAPSLPEQSRWWRLQCRPAVIRTNTPSNHFWWHQSCTCLAGSPFFRLQARAHHKLVSLLQELHHYMATRHWPQSSSTMDVITTQEFILIRFQQLPGPTLQLVASLQWLTPTWLSGCVLEEYPVRDFPKLFN